MPESCRPPMPLKRTRALLAISLATLLSPGLAAAAEVSLTGESQVQYQPDSARLHFTVSAEQPTAEQATAEVKHTMDQWRDAIASYRDGLVNYSDANATLYQRRIHPEPRPNSGDLAAKTLMVASQTITFEIHDLELLNTILAQAQTLGMNYHLGPQQFFHSEQAQLERQALAGAIANARENCEFAASQLELSCGEVKTLSLDRQYRPVQTMMAEAKSSGGTIGEVGPREISATVSATFSME